MSIGDYHRIQRALDQRLTWKTLAAMITAAGNTQAPAVLYTTWKAGMVTTRQLQAWLPRVWNIAEYPHDTISNDMWREMFGTAGYTSDGTPATPPETIQLYRGCAPEYRTNWSWTDHLLAAAAHAVAVPGRKHSPTVWATTAPGEAVLIHRTHVDFDEYVIDTDGLSIEQVRPPILADAVAQHITPINP